ncbi:hypothetical protein N7519_003927 [Penicillium mononematosum]|uniref:uncharacterized protein n=1 Tax=Penicillium mononematosum TaxID=268346 RepID=UPI00254672B8|nr:uncharacterized protein N7519_003927 [Penicillium mononematosum]KAJ6189019.1 hypothetical protein N7519_003927 [Penicillium mononematosum]
MGITASNTHETTTSGTHDDMVNAKPHFNFLGCLGMNFSISMTPLAIGTYLSLSIGTGGPPFFLYEFIFAGLGQIVLCVALAEMASGLPHSSGPAYWVVVLGPKALSRPLGYVVGWLTNACWFFISCASFLFLAQLTMALVEAAEPSYNPKVWHTYLIYCAFATNGFLVNLPRVFKVISWSLSASVFIINASALFIFISLLVRAHPKQSARTVFVDVVNKTGWDSDVVVFFLSILPGAASVGGLDSALHLTDEVDRPSKQIPMVMISSALLSFFTGIPSIIIYLFCNTNPEGLLDPVGGQPIIQLFFDAYDSKALSILASTFLIMCFTIAGWAALTSWNRLYWSFSRDRGFPFSQFSAKLSSSDDLPINALYINLLLIIALGAVQLGSTTAMNALLGGASLCGKSSFGIALALLLWRGRDSLPRDRWLNLGKYGVAVDAIAILWIVWMCIWISFPCTFR